MTTVGELKAAPYNPRKISKEQLAILGRSMKEYGDLSGVVFNTETGHLVGGHQRLKHLDPAWEIVKANHTDKTGTTAAGVIETPWGRISYREVKWPEAKEKAANLAANKMGGDFDFHGVTAILKELDGLNFDLDMTGFLKDERLSLMGAGEGLTDPDEVPAPPKKAITKMGDLWILGEHRLLCGDSTKPEDVKRLMDGTQADLLFADPPYGVDYGAKNRFLNSFLPAGRNLQDIKGDTIKKDALFKMLVAAFSNAREVMKDTSSFYVTAPQGGELGLMMMMMMMIEAQLPTRHVLNWIKSSPTFSLGRLDYDYQHEPILYGWKKTHKFIGGGQHTKSIWPIDKPRESKEHPTMKPVLLMINAILNSTLSGAIVLDHFAGSGSTLIAAEQTRRRCFALEIEPLYCDVIVKRWENFTGRKATHG
jgi:DNA modification methylase